MATHFKIVHPVRHAAKDEEHTIFPRGTVVPAKTFSDKSAAQLIAAGSIVPHDGPAKPAKVVAVAEPTKVVFLDAEELAKLKNADLVEYAAKNFGEKITGTKEEMVLAIQALIDKAAQ